MIFIPVLALAAGSFFGGRLSRQPEVNRLKDEIIRLQNEVKRLNKIISEQNDMINNLKMDYKKLRATHFIQKNNLKKRTRGIIIFQYAYKEYIQLCILQSKRKEICSEEKVFYNIFDLLIHGKEVSLEDKGLLKMYVENLYPYEIKNLTPIDSESIVEEVEAAYSA